MYVALSAEDCFCRAQVALDPIPVLSPSPMHALSPHSMQQATQLVSASEDDHNPVVQLWDLRNANSPVKELSGHTKGILHLDWCSRDASLLLSCGKDNRTLVWDPLVEEGPDSIIAELPTAQNWVFEVAWCPRNPGWRTANMLTQGPSFVSDPVTHSLSHACPYRPDFLPSTVRQV